MERSSRRGRLAPRPSQVVDLSSTVVFDFNGRPIRAHEGDTVASALYAAGVRILSRSFKYHRPRGLLCASGRCPNCMMTVDGVPNVRTCGKAVSEGMTVRHQNAWPSLEHDLFAVLDRLDWFLPVGFYYKAFHSPKFLWRLASPIIRRVAGLGSVNVDSASDTRYHHESLHADVAVVGGGAAGMSAALAAAAAGARVTLIDDQPTLGGHLRFDSRTHGGLPDFSDMEGYELAVELERSVRAMEGIDVLSGATAFGYYEGNLLGVLGESRMIKLRARRIVIATGSQELPLTFDRNDVPGVMLGTALQRLIHLYGIKPGSSAVVATTNDQGYDVALDLLEAGVRIAVVADSRPGFPHRLAAAASLQSRGILVLDSHVLARAEGVKRVVGAVVARQENGSPTTEERQFDCDLIAVSGGFQAADSLLYQAGGKLAYDDALGESVPLNLPSETFAAGDVTGIHDLAIALAQGRLAGLEAAAGLGRAAIAVNGESDSLRSELAASEASYRGGVSIAPVTGEPEQGAKRFVCFCEDVTAKDIANAVDEGFEDVQTLKRYTTVTMGPCQGKMCLKHFVGISARRAGKGIGEAGVTTARPPVQPVPLAALAGPSHMPVKLTSIDKRHRELGAKMVDVGPWQRPYSYGSPQEECQAVRRRVGIIDVSTLGKLDVRGRDAPALLDKVYTHNFASLRPGRIRYGLLCADNGTILDDGTVTRLAEDHYFVTTSTAAVESIEEWFKWWMAGTGMCAHVTNVTSGLAAINVAGPRARETLAKLTGVDLSPDAFRYMRSAHGEVAGVPSIFMRIGFVGETGWEVHFPAEYGEYLWDALMDAGEEFGISPFGTEAQRILRLEKLHIIPNHDTDMVSNPLNSDMEWVVRFDKEDFIGRGTLAMAKERGLRNKLVGFVMRDGRVPDDGDPVVAGFAPVGRVTSSRLSPTLGKGFGFAWVPIELAEEGKVINIRVDGSIVPADVTLEPVYDPKGLRLRE